jgi:putative DNA primase/helicase
MSDGQGDDVVDFGAARARSSRRRGPAAASDYIPPPTSGPNGEPVILLVGGTLPAQADQAVEVLSDPRLGIYSRGPSLVRPTTWAAAPPTLKGRSKREAVQRPEGAVVLAPVDETALVDVLTRAASFMKFDARGKEWIAKDCPTAVAGTILARRGHGSSIRPLKQIIRTPCLRSDGTLISEPGYDEASQLLFVSDLAWPRMSPKPELAECEFAMDILKDALSTFPFVDKTDLSAALAAMITAVLRPALSTAPLFAITAPSAGTGKSKLADLAAILATGRVAPVISGSVDEAELEKRLGSCLMAGDPLVCLDNLSGPLRGDLLCSILTQTRVNVRVLGESRNCDLPSIATWFCTGNNLAIAGDMSRRVCLIRLDAKCERPEDRKFDRDVIAFFLANRARLVVAALTVVRGFLIAGKHPVLSAMGSFEDWSETVRAAIVWTGYADPLGNAAALQADNPVRERAMMAFSALKFEGVFTAAEIKQRASRDSSFADALGDFSGKRGEFDAHTFGSFLRNSRDQQHGGLTLKQVEGHAGAARWRVTG